MTQSKRFIMERLPWNQQDWEKVAFEKKHALCSDCSHKQRCGYLLYCNQKLLTQLIKEGFTPPTNFI
ncbi:MAG: hypothetical protein KGD65_03315 [Candidatus Lokiarchaeota archaeon]|nr:hypothetical protein [Candidatus Lokiarchaeota archaeon]